MKARGGIGGVALAGALATACTAGPLPPPQLSGYVKDLLSVTDAHGSYQAWGLTDRAYLFDDYLRARLKVDWRPTPALDLLAHYEVAARLGDTARIRRRLEASGTTSLLPASILGTAPRRRFLDLEGDVAEGDGFTVTHDLDRLQARWIGDRTELSVGRQAVSWGTGLLWNPTDLFTSFSPTEIDRDEKPGVDVARLLLYPAQGVTVDVVAEPLDRDRHYAVRGDDSSLAARVSGHAGEYNFSACGGVVAGDRVLGGDFTGYLWNAGFRGEALYTWVDESDQRDYFRGLLSLDYSFAGSWDPYVALEYFYNGLGATHTADYLPRLAESSVQRAFERGTAFNIGRHYVGGIVRLTPSALLGLQATTLWNLLDSSLSEYASATVSTSQNTDVTLAALFGAGRLGSEFGGWSAAQAGRDFRTPSVCFVYGKWYF